MSAACFLGHTQKAKECPACSGSTDPEWWKWYRGRTMSKAIKAAIDEHLTAVASRAAETTE